MKAFLPHHKHFSKAGFGRKNHVLIPLVLGVMPLHPPQPPTPPTPSKVLCPKFSSIFSWSKNLGLHYLGIQLNRQEVLAHRTVTVDPALGLARALASGDGRISFLPLQLHSVGGGWAGPMSPVPRDSG